MRSRSRKGRRLALVGVMVGVTFGTLAPSAMSAVPLSFERIHGFDAPGTPAQYDSVGVLKAGPKSARNTLVLNPGTSASAAYFEPLAKTIVSEAKGWQVWAVERRENLLEDHSMIRPRRTGPRRSSSSTTTSAGSRTRASLSTSSSFRTPTSGSRVSGGCASRSRICGAWSRPRESTTARLC